MAVTLGPDDLNNKIFEGVWVETSYRMVFSDFFHERNRIEDWMKGNNITIEPAIIPYINGRGFMVALTKKQYKKFCKWAKAIPSLQLKAEKKITKVTLKGSTKKVRLKEIS